MLKLMFFASSDCFPRYYEQDLALAKDLQDKLAQAKAYCNLGLAHKALGEYGKAEECQRYLLSLAQALDNTQVTQLPWSELSASQEPVILTEVSVRRLFSGPSGTWETCACAEETWPEG